MTLFTNNMVQHHHPGTFAEDIETGRKPKKAGGHIFEQRVFAILLRKTALHGDVLATRSRGPYIQEHLYGGSSTNMFGVKKSIDLMACELTKKTAARAWSVVLYTKPSCSLPGTVPDG